MSTSRGALQAKNARTSAMGNKAAEIDSHARELTDDRSSGSPRTIAHARALGATFERTGPRPVEPVPLGGLLADVREGAGLSARALAARIGAAPSSVSRIERSERRVSPSMLRSIATALAPDDPEPLLTSLMEAAGPHLVDDTPGGVRRRERRMRRAAREVNRRAAAQARRRQAMQRQAVELTATAYDLIDRPGAFDDIAALDRIDALLTESQRLQAAAGAPFGPDFDRQMVLTAKIFGHAATRVAGKTPTRRRKTSPPPPPEWRADQ